MRPLAAILLLAALLTGAGCASPGPSTPRKAISQCAGFAAAGALMGGAAYGVSKAWDAIIPEPSRDNDFYDEDENDG